MKISYFELEEAYFYVSSTNYGENRALICKETGKIYYRSNWYSEEENVALFGEIDEGCDFIEVPHKYDLDLGSALVFDFVEEFMPDDFGKVRGMFRRRGAYARFKDFLERRGMLDAWHEYENSRTEKALRAWCREVGIELED